MAEGLLGGILGEEDEKPEVEAETLAGADAFAAAVAAKLAGNDPGVARKTEIFLDRQAQLLEIQAQHLKDEHEARLHFLRGQAREVDLRRFGLRLRVGFQLFLVLVATVIGIGGAVSRWRAGWYSECKGMLRQSRARARGAPRCGSGGIRRFVSAHSRIRA